METSVKRPTQLFKKLGFLGIGLCAVCCAIPIIGAVIGIGALSSLAIYFEKAGLVALIASGGLLAIWHLKKQKEKSLCKASCDSSPENSCGCKTESGDKESNPN